MACPGTMLTNMTYGIVPSFFWTLMLPFIWLVSDPYGPMGLLFQLGPMKKAGQLSAQDSVGPMPLPTPNLPTREWPLGCVLGNPELLTMSSDLCQSGPGCPTGHCSLAHRSLEGAVATVPGWLVLVLVASGCLSSTRCSLHPSTSEAVGLLVSGLHLRFRVTDLCSEVGFL